MKRREFIMLFGSAAAMWSATARAQQTRVSVIGFIGTSSPSAVPELLAAFHRGLSEMGYSEGQNVRIEYRWGEGQYDRLPALAGELVQDQVTAIATMGGSRAAGCQGGDYKNPHHF